jgi:protein-tyrosine-phosphatase
MMQALLQQQLGNGFQVESAGICEDAAGQPANDYSIMCLQERGIDLTQHRSRWVGAIDLTQFSHIICVGDGEAEQISERLSRNSSTTVLTANGDRGGIPNPYKKGLPAYRECLTLLDEVVHDIARWLR